MNVSDEIKALLLTVQGIGQVYDEFVNITSESEVNDKLTADEKVSTVIFFEVANVVTNGESFANKVRNRTFRFALYYGYNYEQQSSKQVNKIKENMMNVFNVNETLNDSVTQHNNLSMTDNIFVTFGNILCHLLLFELTTEENLLLQ